MSTNQLEGVRLTAITARTRTSEDDHLSLLLAVGADTDAAESWIERVDEIGFDEQWSQRLATLISDRRDHLLRPV